jgi:molybdopterin/thiamine biosynthesis adenylyltransferase
MLSERERERYSRQMLLAEIGGEGQEKLKRVRVAVAGIGGLGSVVSLYLTAAGLGSIRIIDHDKVSLSDLNRQVLYTSEDVGRSKVDAARERLSSLNPEVNIEAVSDEVTSDSVIKLVAECNLIVDGMDSLPARYVLNHASVQLGIPLFHGAVYGFEGRAMTVIPGKTPCLRCLYSDTVPAEETPVLGTTPAVIGCIQATEVVKYVIGAGDLLLNRLLIYDGLGSSFREVVVERDAACEACRHLTGQGMDSKS